MRTCALAARAVPRRAVPASHRWGWPAWVVAVVLCLHAGAARAAAISFTDTASLSARTEATLDDGDAGGSATARSEAEGGLAVFPRFDPALGRLLGWSIAIRGTLTLALTLLASTSDDAPVHGRLFGVTAAGMLPWLDVPPLAEAIECTGMGSCTAALRFETSLAYATGLLDEPLVEGLGGVVFALSGHATATASRAAGEPVSIFAETGGGLSGTLTLTYSYVPIPEPATALLLGAGALAFAKARRSPGRRSGPSPHDR